MKRRERSTIVAVLVEAQHAMLKVRVCLLKVRETDLPAHKGGAHLRQLGAGLGDRPTHHEAQSRRYGWPSLRLWDHQAGKAGCREVAQHTAGTHLGDLVVAMSCRVPQPEQQRKKLFCPPTSRSLAPVTAAVSRTAVAACSSPQLWFGATRSHQLDDIGSCVMHAVVAAMHRLQPSSSA